MGCSTCQKDSEIIKKDVPPAVYATGGILMSRTSIVHDIRQ